MKQYMQIVSPLEKKAEKKLLQITSLLKSDNL